MNLWQSFFNIPRAELWRSSPPGVTDSSPATKCNLNTFMAEKLYSIKFSVSDLPFLNHIFMAVKKEHLCCYFKSERLRQAIGVTEDAH